MIKKYIQKFNDNNKLIIAIKDSFFILEQKDIELIHKFYNLFKKNKIYESFFINDYDSNINISDKSINYIILLSFTLLLISYKISFNLKHMLNNNNKVRIFIKKYGETITQLVCFCIPLEINKLLTNNKNLRDNFNNDELYDLISQLKMINNQSFIENS